jgi:hypothetical protein
MERSLPATGPEREMLEGFLNYYRATLLWKVEGLDREGATRRLVPSETTLLGLVKHCASVERGWFRITMDGEDIPHLYYSDEDPNADFRIEPDETVESIAQVYRDECAAADRAAAKYALDDFARAPRPGRPVRSLRWIYLHMIEETARHCGHADILREQIDGATGD